MHWPRAHTTPLMLFWIVPYLDGAQNVSPLAFVMQAPCPQMTSPDEVFFKQSAGVEVDTTSSESVTTSGWKVHDIRVAPHPVHSQSGQKSGFIAPRACVAGFETNTSSFADDV